MSAKKNVFAFLVGIDEYPIAHHRLNGCVNDTLELKSYLESKFSGDEYNFKMKVLLNDQAKRQEIVNAFLPLSHADRKTGDDFTLADAKQEDLVIFHFSGHGSQQAAPKEFWHGEPSRQIETLLCWDSRLPGSYDLTSKELRYLIYTATKSKPHFFGILDCCHSGKLGRNAQDNPHTKSRMAEAGNTARALSDYLGYKEYITLGDGKIEAPLGHFVLLGAARADQTAKETLIKGKSRGVFTYSLLETLQETPRSLSYAELLKRLQTKVISRVGEQNPQILASDESLKTGLFLSGAQSKDGAMYQVNYSSVDGWTVNVGQIQGIPLVEMGTSEFYLYAEDSKGFAPENAICVAQASYVSFDKSFLQLDDESLLASDKTYLATIKHLPIPKRTAYLMPSIPADLVEAIKAACAQNVYTTWTEDKDNANYCIDYQNNALCLRYPNKPYPLYDEIQASASDSSGLRLFATKLEHVAKWENLFERHNPHTQLDPSCVQLSIERQEYLNKPFRPMKKTPLAFSTNNDLSLHYLPQANEWLPPYVCLKLNNSSSQKLYVALLTLSAGDFLASNQFMPGEFMDAGSSKDITFKTGSGQLLPFIPIPISSALVSKGIGENRVTFKVLVSTEEFSAADLNLEDINKRFVGDLDSFSIGSGVDWTCIDYHVNIVMPQSSGTLGQGSTKLSGMSLSSKSGLKGKVMLSSVKEATRGVSDAGGQQLGGIFAPDEQAEFVAFAKTNAFSPPPSVLEISGIEGLDRKLDENQQPETQLEIALEEPLADNEAVVPYVFDPDLGIYMPVDGRYATAQHPSIEVFALPKPTPTGERSLGGSIKMFFKKVIYEKLGFESHDAHTKLCEVQIEGKGDDLRTRYTKVKKDEHGKKVAEAKRILLFIHGIIGDTRDMAKAIKLAKFTNEQGEEKSIDSLYDLVLSFDYENLNTPIEKTAEALGEKLAQIGLKEGHGKTFHIVAHSMGGLVSRTFIENLGGSKVVSQLFMFGTPNGGSAWADIQDFAKVGVGMIMGKLSFAAPLLAPLTWLMNETQVTLAQMDKDDSFIKGLAKASDPGVPYVMVAGDVYERMQVQENQGFFKKLLAKTASKVLDSWVFGDHHDIAVSVEGIFAVPEDRNPKPVKHQVLCDHMSYFVDKDSLALMGKLISEACKN